MLQELMALSALELPRLQLLQRAVEIGEQELDKELVALCLRIDPVSELFAYGSSWPHRDQKYKDDFEGKICDCLLNNQLEVEVSGFAERLVILPATEGGCLVLQKLSDKAQELQTGFSALVEQLVLTSGLELHRQSLRLLNDIYCRALGQGEGRRDFGFVFERLRFLFGYDICALVLLHNDKWRLHWRFSKSVGDSLKQSANEHLFAVLGRDHGLSAEKLEIREIFEEGAEKKLGETVESSVILPLLLPENEESQGLIALFSSTQGVFTSTHLRLLGLLSPGLSTAIQNSEFLFDLEQSHTHLVEQIDMAAQIQEGLLPASPPVSSDYVIAQRHRQAKRVGGDFFSYRLSPSGELNVALADVAGKGIPAAMLASFVLGALQEVWADEDCPSEVLDRLDQLLGGSLDPFRFVTMATLKFVGRKLYYATAGHEPIFVLRSSNEHKELKMPGLPLGIRAGGGFGLGVFDCEPGDIVVVYTDGLSEARRSDGKMFGRANIAKIVTSKDRWDGASFINAFFSSVEKFLDGEDPPDDQTAVAIKVL